MSPSQSIMEGSQGRTSRRESAVRTEAEVMDGKALLPACSLLLAQPAFLYNPGPSAQGGMSHSGLALPTAIISQENATQTSPQVNLMEAFSELKSSSVILLLIL